MSHLFIFFWNFSHSASSSSSSTVDCPGSLPPLSVSGSLSLPEASSASLPLPSSYTRDTLSTSNSDKKQQIPPDLRVIFASALISVFVSNH